MDKITTERLILREWKESDSADLYEYACNELVGPNAGWPPHQNEDESKEIIKMFINDQSVYAIELKSTGKVIGGIGMHDRSPDLALKELDQREIGYVLNPKYWGNGYVPEAVNGLIDFGFQEMNLDLIWCGHYEENAKSKRVNEKCGFEYRFNRIEEIKLLQEERNVYYYCIEKSKYSKQTP